MPAFPACGTRVAAGVHKPRRPQAARLFRLVSDHFLAFHAAYEERFAAQYGDWRPVVREVADKFLACGVLEHGFARVRCDACAHEYLLAFSCKARYFCPSCHAKRLALWTLWLPDDAKRCSPGNPAPGAIGSMHMRGVAVDMRNMSGTIAEWDKMIDAALTAQASYIEPDTGPCTTVCTHADWRRRVNWATRPH